jgi:hypothetical protein
MIYMESDDDSDIRFNLEGYTWNIIDVYTWIYMVYTLYIHGYSGWMIFLAF